MNILGINGSVGWDGNISSIGEQDFWVHGSGATLFIDGELKGALSEERFTREKYDGNYPENVIARLLGKYGLTEDDIDIVSYVSNACLISFALKANGYTVNKLKSIFKNARIKFVDHHLAHAAASFFTSGFDEANIFTFDGAGDTHPNNFHGPVKLNNSSFLTGNINTKTLEPIQHTHLSESFNLFGEFYSILSWIVYMLKTTGSVYHDLNRREPLPPERIIRFPEEYQKIQEKETAKLINLFRLFSFNSDADVTDYVAMSDEEIFGGPVTRETFPGKVMGLSSYGNYKNVKLKDPFVLIFNNENGLPVIIKDMNWEANDQYDGYSAEDLASWQQHHFEKYLLLYLKNIPEEIKTKKLCLGGGCALNILANSKIIEEGIYEDVHVNTAPNDEGLNFGAAILSAFNHEKELILPENIGCIGFDYTNDEIESALNKNT